MVTIKEAADKDDVLPLRHQISDEKFETYSPNARLRIMKRTREYENNMNKERESDAASSVIEDKKLTKRIKKDDFLKPDRDHYTALPQISEDIESQRAKALSEWEANKSKSTVVTNNEPVPKKTPKKPANKKPRSQSLSLGQGGGSKVTYTKPKSMIVESPAAKTTEEQASKPEGQKPQSNISDDEIEKMWGDPASWGSDFPKELFDDEEKECMNVINGDNCGKRSEHLLNLTGDLPPLELCKDCVGNLMILDKSFKAPKSTKSSIYNRLIKISNKLDQSGFYKEADMIDLIIKSNL